MYRLRKVFAPIAFVLVSVGLLVIGRRGVLRVLRRISSTLPVSRRPENPDSTPVAFVDVSTNERTTFEVETADTPEERYVGLSHRESLGAQDGMLFVHKAERRQPYVMRDMQFPLDIVFVASDGTITAIHEAPCPSDDADSTDLTRYWGYGLYVVELPQGTMDRLGITEGDMVVIPETISIPSPGLKRRLSSIL